jgi:hypothetical protein
MVSMNSADGAEVPVQRGVTEAAFSNYEKLAPVWSAATDDGPHNAYHSNCS